MAETRLESNATLQEDTAVVEYLTTNIDLKKVANAIRAKSGTTAKLSFPDGFALAISNIPTGAPGGAKETWVLMEDADIKYEDVRGTHSISFTDGVDSHYDSMTFVLYDENSVALKYDDTLVCIQSLDTEEVVWEDQYARKLILDAPPTGILKLWIDSNAEKQDSNSNIAVQLSKDAGTIISNGSTSIYPDAPYDALKKVDVTVDVASGAGFKVTFPATATNWDKLKSGGVVQADGAVISMIDYSTLAGKTIPNVVEICSWGMSYQCLRMTVQTGKIMLIHSTDLGIIASIVADGESSITYMGDGSLDRWVPMADTVISAIEMYNTD